MVELSPLTQAHVAALFAPADLAEAEQLLALECAENVWPRNSTPEDLERLRFAAIRLSGGHLQGLRDAIALAKTDWRDLLMESGFGEDVHAHEIWQPRRFEPTMAERWQAGELPSGVSFGPEAPIQILFGMGRGKTGMVIGLTALEPQPRYRVLLSSGQEGEYWQRSLSARRPELP